MQNIKRNFSDIKVLVIGDIMIDQYWWGDVDRISPEAPVPVVHINKKNFVAGGAANVAANVASLGAKPILIGIVGEDSEGKNLLDVLNSQDINVDNLLISKNRPTTVKTRIIANNQHVVRIDQEKSKAINKNQENEIFINFEKQIDKVDIVLLSDYAKGVFSEEMCVRLITKAKKRNKLIIVDPKGKNYQKYKGSTVLTPNQKESLEAVNLEFEGEESIEIAGNKMQNELDLECLIITRGKDGMSLFQKDEKTTNLNASARKIFDVTGAGDTVIATLATAIGAGYDFQTAAKLANTAGGKVVEQVGTSTIKIDDLVKEFVEK